MNHIRNRPATRALGRCPRTALALAVALAATLAAVSAPAACAEGIIKLNESGSTLLYPLFNTWIAAYSKTHPGVQLSAAATGSEAGVAAVIASQVQIGASDAYLSDAQVRHNPQLIDIALAISAQTVNYNVPGLGGHLKLDGPTLAGIYTGSVRTWDAPPIAALNPGAGMVQAIAATPYSIGYVGVSFGAAIASAKLGTAALKNAAGEFVLATRDTITTGAASLGSRTPADERLSLVFAPASGSYPLVNYEYAVVSRRQPDAAVATALRNFLSWSIVPSETKARYLDTVQFIPLPPHTWELSQMQIQSIK